MDAAHGLGTRTPAARRSAAVCGATCFSFYATKNLPLGEGGMVTTDDPARGTEWLRKARLHGMTRPTPGEVSRRAGVWRYNVADAGLKANMTDIQAAMGRAQLAHLAPGNAAVAQIAARYDEQLAGLPGIRLPHRPDLGTAATPGTCTRSGCSQSHR